MNLRELALEALAQKRAEAQELAEEQAQSLRNIVRIKFEKFFSVSPEAFEDPPNLGSYVDVLHQGIRLRYLRLCEHPTFFLVAPCPECGEEVVGSDRITDMASLGKALHDFQPSHTHMCPAVASQASAAFEPTPTWQDLLDALNRIGEELARANDIEFGR